MGRTLALDAGTKRTGAAISDELGITAQPVGVRERVGYKSDLAFVREIMKKYDVERIVVGYPVNMDGSVGERAAAAEKLARKLERDVKVEVVLWDERLTTVQAEKTLISADVSRKKRKKVVDQMAAQLILSSWLESPKGGRRIRER